MGRCRLWTSATVSRRSALSYKPDRDQPRMAPYKTGHVPILRCRAQAALLDFCVEQGIRVLALDNISCLFSGIPEEVMRMPGRR